MAKDEKIERHIDKVTLVNLFNADMVASRAAAEERGAIGSRIKGLQESHGLNTVAYRIAKAIAKRPVGDREQLKRAVDLYCDHLGVGEQGDLEDVIEKNVRSAGGRTETEAVMDGQPPDRADAGRVGSILRPGTPSGDAAITAFKSAMGEAATHEAVNMGLDRFTKDNPYLADAAGAVAIARITAIDLAASDGEEDVRPEHLKEAPKNEAKQIVADAKASAKATRPAKVKPATDKSKGHPPKTAAIH